MPSTVEKISGSETMKVEVAYARPDKQALIQISVPEDTTLEEAIRVSGVLEQFPEIELRKNKVGIFGKLAQGDHPLHPGDRVEIYRPLIADPKQARRERAAKTSR